MIKKQYKVSGNVLYKMVKPSRHFFKNGKAWGIDKETFDDALQKGVTNIVYYDVENDIEYETTSRDVMNHAWIKDFGFGEQYFLNVKYWKQTNPESFGEPVIQIS